MSVKFRQIVKWTVIGLLIRLALMPFTMHGQDLVFLNYFPMMLVKEGIWDPYGFIGVNFPHFPFTYYGPVLFGVMSAANFILIKLLNPASLMKILEISGAMMGRNFTTVDYVNAFSGLSLFKNLFLMKSPYLLFDFFIAGIILKLAALTKSMTGSYKLWMLNIVALQSVYAVGGAYLIPAFFIVASLYAGVKQRPYMAVILLSLGGATKLFPYLLIPPTCLLLGRGWREKLLLLFTGCAVTLMLYLPFYLSSGSSVLGIFMLSHMDYPGLANWLLKGVFLIFYIYISLRAVKDSGDKRPEAKLLYYFTAILFLSYAAFPMRFRYFVFITPLLALIAPGRKRFGIFTLSVILLLAFQWLTARDLQLGLFAPVNPVYFLNIPTIQELTGRLVNIEIIYRIIARAMPLAFFVAAWWIWRVGMREKAIGANGEVLC